MTTSDEIARFASAIDDVRAGRPPVAVEAGAGAERERAPQRPAAGASR
jgi:hypothetical protein